MAGLILIEAATELPTTTDEVKLFARIDHAVEDSLIERFIKSAVKKIEDYLHGAILEQTWELVLDAFPCGEIELPVPPLISVSSIKYIDVDGVERTVDASVYQVVTDAERGRLSLADGQDWPEAKPCTNAVVRIRFVAGYGDEAADVPDEIVEAVLRLVAVAYKYRDDPGGGAEMNKLILSEIDGLASRRF